jgi:hypothetical protein
MVSAKRAAIRQVHGFQRGELIRARGDDLIAIRPAERAHEEIGLHE